jgi:uncharacterized protein (TIGR03067 family)
MIRIAIYLFVVGLVSIPAAGTPAPRPTQKELIQSEFATLEGTWKVVFCQRDGQELPAAALATQPTLTFKGAEYFVSSGVKGRITNIDPTASPKTLDYKNDGDENAYTFQNGIYKLEGDTFIDCVSLGGKDRPKEFVSKEGSGHVLMKYKRVKE